jgi:hypothetical protein
LYRRDTAAGEKKISLLFGLFQYQCDDERGHARWFYINGQRTQSAEK